MNQEAGLLTIFHSNPFTPSPIPSLLLTNEWVHVQELNWLKPFPFHNINCIFYIHILLDKILPVILCSLSFLFNILNLYLLYLYLEWWITYKWQNVRQDTLFSFCYTNNKHKHVHYNIILSLISNTLLQVDNRTW